MRSWRDYLTPLDQRVLAELRSDRGRRASAIHGAVNARRSRYEQDRASLQEVREVLRGFEHLGQAQHRNGYWRRIA